MSDKEMDLCNRSFTKEYTKRLVKSVNHKQKQTFLAEALHDWKPIQAFLCIRSIRLAKAKNAP